MTSEYRIETQRLLLRPLSEDDLEAWADFLGDPEATRLLHTPDPVHDPDRLMGGLRRWASMYEEPIGMYAALVRAGAETAGFVGFVPCDMPWGRELELGWLLRKRFWGQGYATEAARALGPLAPARVISLIRCENSASANVARKLGMTIEREIDYRGFKTNVWVGPISGSAFEE